MSDADRKAFEAHWKKSTCAGYNEKLAAKSAWQAACEWRDSQVGEHVACIHIMQHKGGENYDLDFWGDLPAGHHSLYTASPTAQINQRLAEALEALLAAVQKCHCDGSGPAQDMAQAALQAAREPP